MRLHRNAYLPCDSVKLTKVKMREALQVRDTRRAFFVGGDELMPSRPKHPCAHPGCPELIPYGEKYCEKHASLHTSEKKDTRAGGSAARGYGWRWQKASKAFLHAHPLCAECERHGKYTRAEVVDHIVPHRGDMKLFWDRDNWQPLCKQCHDKKTAREDRNFLREYTY